MAASEPPIAWTIDEDVVALARTLRERYPRDREHPYRSASAPSFIQPRVIFDGLPYPLRLWWLEDE